MNMWIYIAAGAIGLCAAGATVLFWWQRRKKLKAVPKAETEEDRFLSVWTDVFRTDARVFNGLYSGLQRVASGKAKKPEKVLREWCQRTHYQWESQPVDILSREQILPLIETGDRDGLTNWASFLLDAAAAAGITRSASQTLVLSESTAADYVEWDGNDLYPGDKIRIITSAWYQNGKLLEQGQCRK